MLKALKSLPWVRKASVDYGKKQATVTVLSQRYDEAALLKTLVDAGFRGSVAEAPDDEQKQAAPAGERVAFQVSGMKKTRSGAT